MIATPCVAEIVVLAGLVITGATALTTILPDKTVVLLSSFVAVTEKLNVPTSEGLPLIVATRPLIAAVTPLGRPSTLIEAAEPLAVYLIVEIAALTLTVWLAEPLVRTRVGDF